MDAGSTENVVPLLKEYDISRAGRSRARWRAANTALQAFTLKNRDHVRRTGLFLFFLWTNLLFVAAIHWLGPFAFQARRIRLCRAWQRRFLLRMQSRSKTCRRCATLRQSASCLSPWAPR